MHIFANNKFEIIKQSKKALVNLLRNALFYIKQNN